MTMMRMTIMIRMGMVEGFKKLVGAALDYR
jgi:hypothetical protein